MLFAVVNGPFGEQSDLSKASTGKKTATRRIVGKDVANYHPQAKHMFGIVANQFDGFIAYTAATKSRIDDKSYFCSPIQRAKVKQIDYGYCLSTTARLNHQAQLLLREEVIGTGCDVLLQGIA